MKIQCSVCEASEAKVLCCADDAALCWECDEKVHAANKLAGKHQRIPLSYSGSNMPKCDICQESFGYFFCLEDRALLCRKCDVAIHTANSFVSTHQRFLLAGIRVGLEATEPGASSSSAKSHSEEKTSDAKSSSASRRVSSVPKSSEHNEVIPAQGGGGDEQFPPSKVSYGGGSAPANISNWPIDDFFGLNEFTQNYNCMDNEPSDMIKFHDVPFNIIFIGEFLHDDRGKPGDSDSAGFKSNEEEIDEEEEEDDDDCLGRFSDSSWKVPQISSLPTASGLYWPRDTQYTPYNAMFAHVPDIFFPDSTVQPCSAYFIKTTLATIDLSTPH